ncbi:MAG: hypothetical protein ACOX5K_05445 [Bacteroidales bacterium]|jgi:hypothetical protein
MGKKDYTLKFIQLGKDKKTYLRYYCAGKTCNINCKLNVTLSTDELKKLNAGSLGGIVQEQLNELKSKIYTAIFFYKSKNKKPPNPNELKKIYNNLVTDFNIGYWKQHYFKRANIKESTKKQYTFTINKFERFIKNELDKYSVDDLLSEKTVELFLFHIEDEGKYKNKPVSESYLKNQELYLLQFLNHVCGELNKEKLKYNTRKITVSDKYNLTETDITRLLNYKTNNPKIIEVQDIININKKIGLRITEILNIYIENITLKTYRYDITNIPINDIIDKRGFENAANFDYCEIKFLETKKSKSRTIILAGTEQINIINKRIKNKKTGKLFTFKYDSFKGYLRKLCKEVFKEETIQLFIAKKGKQDIKTVLKSDVITSHALRRYAIQKNIAKYGVEVARQFSGHTNTAIIYRHYANFLEPKDVLSIMLRAKK